MGGRRLGELENLGVGEMQADNKKFKRHMDLKLQP